MGRREDKSAANARAVFLPSPKKAQGGLGAYKAADVGDYFDHVRTERASERTAAGSTVTLTSAEDVRTFEVGESWPL